MSVDIEAIQKRVEAACGDGYVPGGLLQGSEQARWELDRNSRHDVLVLLAEVIRLRTELAEVQETILTLRMGADL